MDNKFMKAAAQADVETLNDKALLARILRLEAALEKVGGKTMAELAPATDPAPATPPAPPAPPAK